MILVWILLCIIWGTTWIFIKLGLNDLPPAGFAATRFTVACLILLFILGFQKLSIPSSRIALVVFTGILQFTFNYGLLFWAEKYITSGLAAVLQTTIPVFGMILARIFVGEVINGLKVASILLGILGVALIFWEQLYLTGTMALLGSLAVVVGAFGAALASVLVKSQMRQIEPASLLFWQMFIGHLPLWVISFIFEGAPISFRWTKNALICVLYLAIFGSILAFWLYYWLLRKIEVTKAMSIALVTPIVAIFVGSFFGEEIGLQAIVGGLMVLLSVSLLIFQSAFIRVK